MSTEPAGSKPKYTHRVTKPWTGYQAGQFVDASQWRNREAMERTRFITPIDVVDVVAQELGRDPSVPPPGEAKVTRNEGQRGTSRAQRRNAETGEVVTQDEERR